MSMLQRVCGHGSAAAGRHLLATAHGVPRPAAPRPHGRCLPARAAAPEAVDAAAAAQDPVDRAGDVLEELLQPGQGLAPPTFTDLGMDPMFLAALQEQGITAPSPIQEAALPVVLGGSNAAIQSYTGSGKTLAYLLPALSLAFQRAEAAYKASPGAPVGVQVLVVAPSQELALQIMRVGRALLPETLKPAVQQCIGGANGRRQREALLVHKPLLVVGTPGRLAQFVREGVLLLHGCPMLVLDEADQLLGDNFREDLSHVAEHCGRKAVPGRQTVLVSATLSQTVLGKFLKWCPEPVFVTSGGAPVVDRSSSSSSSSRSGGADAIGPAWGWGVTGWDGPASDLGPRTQGTMGGAEGADLVPTMPPSLRHLYLVSPARHRVDTLRRTLYALGATRALAFMNWQQRLQDAKHKLRAKNIQVEELHGEMSKMGRGAVLEGFKKGAFPLLLVNDVAARGLDLPQIDVVVNLELPSNAAHYAHRAGRTGRMGSPGTVVTLVTPEERFVVERLSHKLGVPILEAHLSGGEVVIGPPPPQPAKPARKKPAAAAADTPPSAPAAAGDAAGSSISRKSGRAEQGTSRPTGDTPSSSSSSSSSTSTTTSTRSSSSASSSSMAVDAATPSTSSSNGQEAWRKAFNGVPGLKPGDDEEEIVDLEDALEVEGDEAPEEFRSRFLSQLAAELQEVEGGGQSQGAARSSSSRGGRGSGSGSSSRGGRGSGSSRRDGKGVRLRGSAKKAVAELQALFEGEQQAPAQQEQQQQGAGARGKGRQQEGGRS